MPGIVVAVICPGQPFPIYSESRANASYVGDNIADGASGGRMDEEQGLKEQPESELRSRNQPHILWAARVAASLAIVAAFCFVPVRLFFQNLSDSAGMQNLTQPTVLSPPTDNYYGPPTEIYPYGSSDVCVAFEFLNMDPATSFATFGIVVGLAPPGRQPIRQWVKGGDTLLLRIGSNVGLSSILIPVSTSALQPVLALPRDQPSSACNNGSKSRYIRGAGFRMLQNIFVLGQPRAFPNDWYELDDEVTVYLCAAKQSNEDCTSGLNQNGTASTPRTVPASLIMTTRDEDWTVTVNKDGFGSRPTASQLAFILRRPSWVIKYTYFIAILPFLLIIGLFVAYARRKQIYGLDQDAPKVHEIAFGVAAALVAILPLRAVLVPSSLPNLTRLDIVFSTGAALLVGLSLTWVLVWTKPKKDKKRKPSGGSGG